MIELNENMENHTGSLKLHLFLKALSEECVNVSETTLSIQNALYDILEGSYISPENMNKLQLLDTIAQIQMDMARALTSIAIDIPENLTLDRRALDSELTLHEVKRRLGIINDSSRCSDTKFTSGEFDVF